MKYLVIDNTKSLPIRGVIESGGSHVGNTQMLGHEELKDYSKWLGLYGGRSLVDAFEVSLINDGMLLIWPVDEAGDALHDECDALEIRHYDTGARLVWEVKIRCNLCCGQGHFNLYGQAVEEEDLCPSCDGNGHNIGPEFETDIDGNLLTPNVVANRPIAVGWYLG